MKGLEIQGVIQKRAYKSSSFLLRWSKKVPDTRKTAKNIAILTPKKVFKTAVERNRARRRLKYAFSQVFNRLIKKEGGQRVKKTLLNEVFVVITANKTALSVKNKDLIPEIELILNESGIINA